MQELTVPALDITSALIWIWFDGLDQGTNIPLRVSNISLDAVDTSGDTTSPQAFLKSTPQGELIDRAGNVTPSQVVGTFVVNLDSPPT